MCVCVEHECKCEPEHVCVCLRASGCFLGRSWLYLWLSPAAATHVNGVVIRGLGRTWLSLAELTGFMKSEYF